MNRWQGLLLLILMPLASCAEERTLIEIEPPIRGPLPVGSTNMEVADTFADIGDDAMHNILIGQSGDNGTFVTDIMKHPESAWVLDVTVPDDPDVYGPTAGTTMPVSLFITYPTVADDTPNRFAFPYFNAQNGEFENMLTAGESPVLSMSEPSAARACA